MTDVEVMCNGNVQYRCLRKKRPLRNFDAKAFFEAWSTASDVAFREESEFKVKNSPKLLRKNKIFANFGKI